MILLRRSDGYACCGPLGRYGIDEFGWCAGLFRLYLVWVQIRLVWVFLRCWNRLRVGVSVAVSGLVTLLVLFGGDVLGRGLRVRRLAVGGSCADAPRVFDVAVMRVRLGLKRVRGIPNHSSSEC